jgi:hypothetical protein
MAREPRTVSLEEGPNLELADMSRRFWVNLALSVPLLFVGMVPMAGLRLGPLDRTAGRWVEHRDSQHLYVKRKCRWSASKGPHGAWSDGGLLFRSAEALETMGKVNTPSKGDRGRRGESNEQCL